MTQVPDYLKKIPFFNSLADEDIFIIHKTCVKKDCNAGEIIFSEGDPGDSLYIVVEGSVEIWKDYNHPEADLLSVYGPGQLFGELALIDDSPRSATVVARQDCRLLSISRHDFEIITRSNPISKSIMKSLSQIIRKRTDTFIQGLHIRNRKLQKTYERMKKSEIRFNTALKKKDYIIKNLNSQVSNHIRMVIDMMGLQASQGVAIKEYNIFQNTQNRLFVLSVAHESLIRSSDSIHMDLTFFFKKIVKNAFWTSGLKQESINHRIDTCGIFLGLEDSVPLGLILNEFMSETLKFSFSSAISGKIGIFLEHGDNNELKFIFIHNGVTLIDQSHQNGKKITGFNIIKGLTEQCLKGSFKAEYNGEEKFTVKFTPKTIGRMI